MSGAVGELVRRFDAGRPLVSAWSSLADPVVHEILCRSFDVLTLDAQHGLHDVAALREGCARGALLGTPVLVRVPIGDLALAARVLDFGASGVILPMVQGAADAAEFARALLYPPHGSRSYGPTRAADVLGYASGRDYKEAANGAVLSLAMIETPGAFAAIDEILAVPELGGIFVGPSDLSLALDPMRLDPTGEATEAAVQTIAARAKAAGKRSAIYALTVEDARRYVAYGYEIVAVASDAGLLRQASLAAVAAVKAG